MRGRRDETPKVPDTYDPTAELTTDELMKALGRRLLDGEEVCGLLVGVVGAKTGAESWSRLGHRTLAFGIVRMLDAALMAPVKFDCPEDEPKGD